MSAVIDRELLEALIQYSESEIETRIACLKDATGDDRTELEAEISEGQEILAQCRTALNPPKDVPKIRTHALRRHYYMASDGIAGLQEALNSQELQDDTGLLEAVTAFSDAQATFYSYINARFIWD
jgi:hypothetical protein